MVLLETANIIAGAMLVAGLFNFVPLVGKQLQQLVLGLSTFQAAIGAVAFVLGVLNVQTALIQGTLAIIVGLVLMSGIIAQLPIIGEQLGKVVKWIGGFQTIIGLAAIILGVLGIAGVF